MSDAQTRPELPEPPDPPPGCECVGWYVPGYRLIFEEPRPEPGMSRTGFRPLFTWDTTE